jgi:hypothetical protein
MCAADFPEPLNSGAARFFFRLRGHLGRPFTSGHFRALFDPKLEIGSNQKHAELPFLVHISDSSRIPSHLP